MKLPIAYGSDQSTYPFVSSGRLVNMYAEVSPSSAKGAALVRRTAGLAPFSSVCETPCRGLFYYAEDDAIYSVHAGAVYKINKAGVATYISQLPGTSMVTIDRNQAVEPEIVICTDKYAYVIKDDVVARVNDEDLPQVNSVSHLNGRFFYYTDGGQFYWSEILDGSNIDSLSFASAEGKADGIVRGITNKAELWIAGSESIEIWGANDDPDAPVARIGGSYIDRGLASKNSFVLLDGGAFWHSSDGYIMRGGAGYEVKRISNHAVERDLAAADTSTISAFGYSDKGHAYYVISSGSWTWAYDVSTQQWHERKSLGTSGRWRANCYVKAWGKHIVGDVISGNLYLIDEKTFSEPDAEIVWEMHTPFDGVFPRHYEISEICIDCLVGQGTVSGDGYNPEIMLSWTDDGQTYKGGVRSSLGKMGEFSRRVKFTRLGRVDGSGRSYKLSGSAPVDFSIIQIDVNPKR